MTGLKDNEPKPLYSNTDITANASKRWKETKAFTMFLRDSKSIYSAFMGLHIQSYTKVRALSFNMLLCLCVCVCEQKSSYGTGSYDQANITSDKQPACSNYLLDKNKAKKNESHEQHQVNPVLLPQDLRRSEAASRCRSSSLVKARRFWRFAYAVV